MPDEELRWDRGHAVRMAALFVLASAVGIAIVLSIRWFPTGASTQAKEVRSLYDVLLVASVPFFVLVESVVLYSVWKFRMKPGEELKDGPPIHGDTRLEVFWTAVPAILLLSLCSYTYFVLNKMERHHANEMRVMVQGQQFAWQFQYPATATGQKVVTSDQLYLPVGQSVEFKVTAKDVIHDFWVPSFSMKIDAVPGNPTSYRITPDRVGTYPVACAELCGIGHATMRSTVHVLPKAKFQTWLTAQRKTGGVQPIGKVNNGRQAPPGVAK